jgi:ribosome assembly protein YihI (activator of Der GTPase)
MPFTKEDAALWLEAESNAMGYFILRTDAGEKITGKHWACMKNRLWRIHELMEELPATTNGQNALKSFTGNTPKKPPSDDDEITF